LIENRDRYLTRKAALRDFRRHRISYEGDDRKRYVFFLKNPRIGTEPHSHNG